MSWSTGICNIEGSPVELALNFMGGSYQGHLKVVDITVKFSSSLPYQALPEVTKLSQSIALVNLYF